MGEIAFVWKVEEDDLAEKNETISQLTGYRRRNREEESVEKPFRGFSGHSVARNNFLE